MLDLDLDDLRQRFGRDGFVRIPRLLDDDQLEELTATYMRFVRREIAVPGRDYCDMAGDYGAAPEDFDVVNVTISASVRCGTSQTTTIIAIPANGKVSDSVSITITLTCSECG